MSLKAQTAPEETLQSAEYTVYLTMGKGVPRRAINCLAALWRLKCRKSLKWVICIFGKAD